MHAHPKILEDDLDNTKQDLQLMEEAIKELEDQKNRQCDLKFGDKSENLRISGGEKEVLSYANKVLKREITEPKAEIQIVKKEANVVRKVLKGNMIFEE